MEKPKTESQDIYSSESSIGSSGTGPIDSTLKPSSCVANALKTFQPDKPVSADELAQPILDENGKEYAQARAASLKLEKTVLTNTPQGLLDEVMTLFDLDPIQRLGPFSKDGSPELNGRMVLIGLILLEDEFKLLAQFESVGAFNALVNEFKPPLKEIMTEKGYTLLEVAQSERETVRTWTDDPVLNPKSQDRLERYPFARHLARRIHDIPKDSEAYGIHVYGPWGAGKSSLLNFLYYELTGKVKRRPFESWLARLINFIQQITSSKESKSEDRQENKKDKWVVVEFNAWRNQNITPPWWSLMETVFRQTRNRLNPRELFQEYLWRLNTGRLVYLLTFVILLWVLVIVIPPVATRIPADTSPLAFLATNAESIATIIALITTVWTSILAFNRSLFLNSARAAQNYAELASDPMETIKKRFEKLVQRLKPWRVAIFIDDLDRCQSRYVVDLLEGIQTLYRGAPIVYVVAADRRWINACYEEVYKDIEPYVCEPGKRLGTLFLEKAFRFSTPMPGVSEQLRQAFWQHLLEIKPSDKAKDQSAAQKELREKIKKATSEMGVRRTVNESHDLSFEDQQAIREEAAVKLAFPEITKRLEHTLREYQPYLESNPRAMKRLVNTYSANQALAFLSWVDIEPDAMALWTILSFRWPDFAAYLEGSPEKIKLIGQKEPEDVPSDFKELFSSADVISIVQKGSSSLVLNADVIRKCAQIHV